MRSFLVLVLFLLICFGVAAFGGQFTPGEWYAALEKPAWNPPSWVFAPVWTVLYALMAVAGWWVWRSGEPGRGAAFGAFALQLVLNGAWSWLFFGLHLPGAAFAEIVALWLAILATVVLFWRLRPLAGTLLVPYLAWVTFAAALNLALWRLNL
jgi:tryptophan-rich sensory protein